MKKHLKSVNMKVMLGLLAVLIISLGYLSMQGREGMTGVMMKKKDEEEEEEKVMEGMAGMEGMAHEKKRGREREYKK